MCQDLDRFFVRKINDMMINDMMINDMMMITNFLNDIVLSDSSDVTVQIWHSKIWHSKIWHSIRAGRAQWTTETYNAARTQTQDESTSVTISASQLEWPIDGICPGYFSKTMKLYGFEETGPEFHSFRL